MTPSKMQRRKILTQMGKTALGTGFLSQSGLTWAQNKTLAERQADMLRPNPALFKSEWNRYVGNKKPLESNDLVLDIAALADNPSAVPVRVFLAADKEGNNRCEEIVLLAEKNPLPMACTLQFPAQKGAAEAAVRLRLSQSQTVHALAKMRNGDIVWAHKMVTVAASGCGM